jgi:uncharacterized phiE125 gp8 family phage protein
MITAPAAEPVTLNDVKDYLRIDADSEDFDSILTGLIIAAREYCETFQNRVYITQTWEQSFDSFPDLPLKFPKAPLQSVESIKFIDENNVESTWGATNYIVDSDSEPGRLALSANGSWPSVNLRPINAVKIRFIAGYGEAEAVPEKMKLAMKMLIAHWFENPEAVIVGGVGSSMSKEMEFAVCALLWGDRLVPV